MFGIENYTAFILAGILLNLTPGSDTIYILTRSVAQGRRAGVVSALGISTGGVIHTLFAAFGLSLILTQSQTLFMIVKYVGAAYLVYLGIKMVFSRQSKLELPSGGNPKISLAVIYRQGILCNTLNPKVALFFISFLPQFISPEASHGPLPFIILGATFLLTGTLWCLFLAYAASMATKTLRGNSIISWSLQKLSGLVFVGLGAQLAFNRN